MARARAAIIPNKSRNRGAPTSTTTTPIGATTASDLCEPDECAPDPRRERADDVEEASLDVGDAVAVDRGDTRSR